MALAWRETRPGYARYIALCPKQSSCRTIEASSRTLASTIPQLLYSSRIDTAVKDATEGPPKKSLPQEKEHGLRYAGC